MPFTYDLEDPDLDLYFDREDPDLDPCFGCDGDCNSCPDAPYSSYSD